MVLHCKLRVGHCKISTDVHVVDEGAPLEQRIPFDWHIHLGETVMEALISASWDADVCYLDALSKKGQCPQTNHVIGIITQTPFCVTV